MRRAYLVAIPLAVLLFLAVSALLARVFSLDTAERSAITALVQDEAAGREAGALARIAGCDHSPTCKARVARNLSALTQPGAVGIIQIQASSGFSLTGTVGTARVAWRVGSSLPIVQCVRVRRAGDAITGFRVELLAISPRIKSDVDCPSRF